MKRDAEVGGYKMRSPRSGEHGQALLEMALVIPLLVILLLGIIEVGRYAELAIIVANAARTGAVYGAQSLITAGNAAAIQDAARNDANLGTNLIVTSTPELLPSGTAPVPPCQTTNDTQAPLPYVIVQTSYTATSLFTSTHLTFNSCAQMQVAQ